MLSEVSYLVVMKGITIKLPEATLQRLRAEARATGRTVAALVRERIEARPEAGPVSVYELTSDLAGRLAGSRRAATNERRKFRRS
jgi:predicted DNA-binding protein